MQIHWDDEKEILIIAYQGNITHDMVQFSIEESMHAAKDVRNPFSLIIDATEAYITPNDTTLPDCRNHFLLPKLHNVIVAGSASTTKALLKCIESHIIHDGGDYIRFYTTQNRSRAFSILQCNTFSVPLIS